jgi:hypothetical protein
VVVSHCFVRNQVNLCENATNICIIQNFVVSLRRESHAGMSGYIEGEGHRHKRRLNALCFWSSV